MTRHRKDIQGLRALAVVLVALNHAGVRFLSGGYIGVDVFFVLSGYLITRVLVRSAEALGHDSRLSYLSTFYANRARRILPAAVLTLVVTAIAASYLLNVYRAHQVLVDSRWATFFAANIHFARIGTNYFAMGQPPSPIQHFWSLAVEEQFYVVWPLLVGIVLVGFTAFGRRNRHRRRPVSPGSYRRLMAIVVVLVTASLVYAVYETHHSPASAYFSTPARAWELGLGALLSLNAHRFSRLPSAMQALLGWGGVGAIILASTLYSASTLFPGVAALLPTVGAAAVIAAGISVKQAAYAPSRVLALRPVRFVGDRSYTFYLWHWPFLVLAMEHAGHSLSLATNLLLLAAAFLLSILTYACVENPIHRTRRPNNRIALGLWPAGIMVVLVVTSVNWDAYTNAKNLAYVSPAAPPALVAPVKIFSAPSAGNSQSDVVPVSPPAVVAAARAAAKAAPIPSQLSPPAVSLSQADTYQAPPGCIASTGQTSTKLCSVGDTASVKSLVVFGDSHAQMWLPDIVSFAQHEGYEVRPLVKLSCSSVAWAGAGSSSDCRAWYKWAVAQVRAIRPSLLILATHYSDVSDSPGLTAQNLTHLGNFYSSVHSSTRQLVVLGDGPGQTAGHEPIDCLERSHATMMSCSSPETQTQLSTDASVSSQAADFGAFLDTTPWFCYKLSCPMVVGHTVVYTDSNHITTTYAEQLAPLFQVTLHRLIVDGVASTHNRHH
jgi:peptidoglycan/LPS O-acetylase OafA/YrhL